MKQMKAYRFRLYPSNEQTKLINKTFGCTRFVYNHYLSEKKNDYETTGKSKSAFDCCNNLKELYSNRDWLKEVDSCALRTSIFDLDDAFLRMYKGQNKYPNFKRKFGKNSYRTNNMVSEYKGTTYNSIKLDMKNKTVTLPKLKEVNIRGYRNLDRIDGRIINATISKDSSNRYYVSVVVEEEIENKEITPNSVIGIDLGIKDLITTSEGTKYKNPKALKKYEKRIKMLQRRLSKKIKGSSNYYKAKEKLGTVYRKLSNTRKYYLNKISKDLTEENDIIVAEKLNIQNMTQNNNLSKSIMDASWYEFIRQLEYKSKYKNKTLIQIDEYYPSSQICSVCNNVNKETKDLSIRKWICDNCSHEHDRDINASINIMFEGVSKYYGMKTIKE